MTLTEFDRRADEVFGPARAGYLVRSHHLAACGGRTAEAALAGGMEVKAVWWALCEDLGVEESAR